MQLEMPTNKGHDCNHCGELLIPGYRRDKGTWTPSRQKKNDYVCTYCDAKGPLNRSNGGSYRSAQRIIKEHEGKLEVSVPTKEGFVYLIENPRFWNWVKVGRALNVMERFDSYQTADPFRGFKLLSSRWFPDRHTAEHTTLGAMEIASEERRGEWFRVKPRVALRVLSKIPHH